MYKRGISAIVATVLIILISIVAISIIWITIIPIIQEDVDSIEQLDVDLSIDVSGGYTVWDSSTNLISVQVARGRGNTNLSGIQFVFIKDGNSITHINETVPERNQRKVYNFNLSGLDGEPDSISIAPVFADGKETIGEVTSKVKDVDVPEGVVDTSNLIKVADDSVPPVSSIPEGYVAWWRFENNVLDETGTNGGTLIGGATIVNDGERGNVLSLDGTGGYISVGNKDSLNFGTGSFSISGWFKAPDTGITRRIVWKDDGSIGYRIYLDNNGKFSVYPRDGTNSLDLRSISTDFDNNEWHHFVYVHNASDTAYIYVDGGSQGSGSVSDIGDLTNTDSFTIGAASGGSAFFTGIIDEVMIFNKALSLEEIQRIYDLQVYDLQA